MNQLFYKIQLSNWVLGTIEKMNKADKLDFSTWSDYWYETYIELDGKSKESGTKVCPQHAAFGLWRLGLIRGSKIPYQNKPLSMVNDEFGKNATYAVIAVDLLRKQNAPKGKANLWIRVQELYREFLHDEPANSEQGAITIAQILYKEGHIVSI